MTWQILEAEPAYGVCDQCKQHTCGIVDGKHKWIMTGIYDRSGDAIVIGYKCVEMWANNLGISLKVVEKEVPVPPTDEQVLKVLKENMVWGQHNWGEANWGSPNTTLQHDGTPSIEENPVHDGDETPVRTRRKRS